ncbi:MAG: tyrosine-type recombinase/integrase [Desulfovibrionaceae bacterium]|nr:tyrosine-type recombinase/integrase [Desulfovibrionaceae bacterium]
MPSKIMKDGRTRWKGRVQKNGLIKQKLCNTRAEALEWEAQERKADWEAATDTVCSLKDWAEKYLDHAGKYDRKTYNEKRQALRELFAARTGKSRTAQQIVNPLAPVGSLTPGKVLAALKVQFESRSGNAANKDRKNLIAAWNWGIKYLGMPGPNPCLVEKFPERRHPRYVPPEEDFWKVFNLTEGQDLVMLLAYLHLGARRSEIFRLCWEDVDFGNSRIRLFTRKRRDSSLEYDWLPMTGELADALRRLWDNRTFTESTHVFICDRDGGFCAEQYGKPFKERMHFMKTLCERAGVKAFGFHAIRHLTASILYKMGQPVSVIQAILRHKSPNTTALYLKSLGLEETRGALDALADRFRTVSGEKTKVVYFQRKDGSTQVTGCVQSCVQSDSGAKADVRLRRKSA